MDHSVIGLLQIVFPIAFALMLCGGGGIMLSQKNRHIRLSRFLILGAVVLAAIYPVLWAYRSPLSSWKVILFASGWGALMGVAFYGAVLWFNNEQAHVEGAVEL